jgi:hypothetical protein
MGSREKGQALKVRRDPGHELLDHGGVIGVVGAWADEDVLPPKGEEELEVRLIHRTSGGGGRERGSGPGHGGGHSSPVRRKALELFLAGGRDFAAVP